MILHKGTNAFEDRLYKMEKNYLRSRYPGLVGYAYQGDTLSIEDGKEIIEKILGDIITIDTDGPHGYESFKLFGEANNDVWHSIVDTDDFPQPSDESDEGDEEDDEKEPAANPGKNGKRGPGKFSTDLDSHIYDLSMDGGPDEELGDSEDFGWYGLMSDGESIADDLRSNGVELEDEDYEKLKAAAGVIIFLNSQGFVEVAYYDTDKELQAAWNKLEEEAEEFYGVEDTGP